MQNSLRVISATLFAMTFVLTPILPVFAQSFDGSGRGFRYDSVTQASITALGDMPIQSLPIPVLLGVEVADLTKNFGDPRSGGRTHEGLDIMAPLGTPIASPTDAVVMRVGNGASSGLYVRTMNPGGESFVYMHLSAYATNIKSGDVLKRGDILGFVGNTGNAAGGPTHLHFEIRKNGATDPFPRLTQVFTLQERMQSVIQALERADAGLATTLASHFRATFNVATAQGIPVPPTILAAIASGVTAPEGSVLQNGIVVFGETNLDIVNLQKFLIATNSGSAGTKLAMSGATGYFGPITQAALVEYQRGAGLDPSGTLDQATKAYIALTHEGDSSETDAGETPSTAFSRDLKLGTTGEDVRALQIFLNTKGFIVASEGAGSPGLESTYFGTRTRAALIRYQTSLNIVPAVGYFGPLTRTSVR